MLIPEMQRVVVFVPRTGSGTLRRALAAKYPKAMLVYRHMEADGVPQGYDRWRRVAVIRRPLDRLWSLYKFLRTFSGNHDAAYIRAMRQSVRRPFEDWLLHNEVVFTSPYDRAGTRYFSDFTVRHPMPENLKSQWIYARPDLGTELFFYEHLDTLAAQLGVRLQHRHNGTHSRPAPTLSAKGRDHLQRFHGWDLEATSGLYRDASIR